MAGGVIQQQDGTGLNIEHTGHFGHNPGQDLI